MLKPIKFVYYIIKHVKKPAGLVQNCYRQIILELMLPFMAKLCFDEG